MMKNVLITGASSGFGRASTIKLAQAGYNITATTRNTADKKDLEEETKDLNVNVIVQDVSYYFVPDYVKNWDVDILINNAGAGESGPIADIPMSKVRSNFETNVFGTLNLTQLVVKDMMLKNKPGKIIFISSVVSRMTAPYLGAYSMTKHAIEAMAKTLRDEVAHHGIKVAVVEPGPYSTGFNEKMMASKYKWFDDTSPFYKDLETIKGIEDWVCSDQFDPEEVSNAIVDIVKAEDPAFRTRIPKAWDDIVKSKLAEG